ncbi:uncharacterized protein N7511_001814 [Penicillium nucicola]|uniref:uncharacterized protein n=1 Tax=Penicillium nucicola TaxID=1850975 RepID=UPI0025450A85|nr:uncharacterized protein N7511_001814 [Penicillium nucicola]KAJ5769763.1 hypothetical protein N7511_001814 [Penicillium nucicola]
MLVRGKLENRENLKLMTSSDPCRDLHHKCAPIPSSDPFITNDLQVTGLYQIAADALVRDEHVHAVDERPDFDRRRVDLLANVFPAIRCGYGRHPEVGAPCGMCTIGSDRPDLIVDFVLESGSGEPDDGIERPPDISAQQRETLGDADADAESMPLPERQATTPPQCHGPKLQRHNGRSSRLSSVSVSDVLERPRQPRSWPLRDPQEAYLLQHFVDKIAPFFDCTDRQQHFAVYIPYRARRCETLFNAMLAMSARHLNRTASFDPFVSDHYYQACLEKLIPALDDHGVTMDDDLLAATVILRLLEEFDVPLAGSDLRGHSFGTKAFIQGPSSMTTTPSLRQAVYWSGLRQEIYNALCLQQAPDIDMSSLNSHFGPLGPDAGDCAWANQAIAHCAEVLVFCFGPAHRSAIVHEELKAQNQQWNETRPSTFDPYFVGGEVEVGTSFPDIRFGCAWHAIGNQYNDLARILLSVHDPNLPTVGPLRRRLVQEADEQIRQKVWAVCGAALSNASIAPAMVVGCLAIHLCGDRFTDPQQQDHLIHVLLQMDALHGWPTDALQRELRETWVVR